MRVDGLRWMFARAESMLVQETDAHPDTSMNGMFKGDYAVPRSINCIIPRSSEKYRQRLGGAAQYFVTRKHCSWC